MKEIKRVAKVGETIKIVEALSNACTDGDLLTVAGIMYPETGLANIAGIGVVVEEIKQSHIIYNSEYVVCRQSEFELSDLKPNMVVEIRHNVLGIIVGTETYGLCIKFEDTTWIRLARYAENMNVFDETGEIFDILTVYGFSTDPGKASDISIQGRKVLWSRISIQK